MESGTDLTLVVEAATYAVAAVRCAVSLRPCRWTTVRGGGFSELDRSPTRHPGCVRDVSGAGPVYASRRLHASRGLLGIPVMWVTWYGCRPLGMAMRSVGRDASGLKLGQPVLDP